MPGAHRVFDPLGNVRHRSVGLMAPTRWILATVWLGVLVAVYQRIGHVEALAMLLLSMVLVAIYGGHGRSKPKE